MFTFVSNLVIKIIRILVKGNPVKIRGCTCSCNFSYKWLNILHHCPLRTGRFLTGEEPEDLPDRLINTKLPGIEVVV